MRRKYKWDDWLGVPQSELVRGEHYHCSQSAFVQMLRTAASHRNLRIRVKDEGDRVVLDVVGPRLPQEEVVA